MLLGSPGAADLSEAGSANRFSGYSSRSSVGRIFSAAWPVVSHTYNVVGVLNKTLTAPGFAGASSLPKRHRSSPVGLRIAPAAM